MMIYAISYADSKYHNPQRLNLESAYKSGADKAIGYTPKDLDNDFADKNASILKCNKGAGYWLWKPYIIMKTMDIMAEGDYLFYSDAGSVYVRNVTFLVAEMEVNREDIVVFELPYIEKNWTKRDTFVLMECDGKEFSETNQRMATFFVVRKSIRSVSFVEEWLKYCKDERILTDKENVMGKDNYVGFIAHRHDQAVLSLLSKKWHITPHNNPSIFFQNWMGEKIIIEQDKFWLSHKMPYISNLEQLAMANRLFYERYWDDSKPLFVYGAGTVGKTLVEKAQQIGKTISGFIVSSKERIVENTISGIPVFPFDELPYDIEECKILVAVKNGIEDVIRLLEYKNAYYDILQDFSRDNLIPCLKVVCNIYDEG